MEKPLLIEIRMMGDMKKLSKKLIYDIYHNFRVRGSVKHRPVPHISLFGPFGCKSIKDVLNAIGEVGSEYSELGYDVDGFDYFELKKKFLFVTTSIRKNVVFLKIIPSEELKEFRHSLAKKLLKITDSSNVDHDSKEKFQFHATIAMKDIDKKFDTIWEYLKNYEIKSKEVCYRITLIRKGKIMYEFDLQRKIFLNRRQVIGHRPSRQFHRTKDRRTQGHRTQSHRTHDHHTHDRYKRESRKTPERDTSSLKECYKILESNENSTPDFIRSSYKRLSLFWHPDKHIDPTRKKIAEEQMKLINNAKTVLEKAGKM